MDLTDKLRKAEKDLRYILRTEDNSWSNQRDDADRAIDKLRYEIKSYKLKIELQKYK